MHKPIIGITTNLLYRSNAHSGRYSTNNNQDYEVAIFKSGGMPILLPPTTHMSDIHTQLNLCDGILLAGGDDLNPLLYGEQPNKYLGETNHLVDTHHLSLAKLTLEEQKPILGICRGMQILNAAKGGNVYQDLSESPHLLLQHQQQAPRADVTHTVTTETNSILNTLLGATFATNSFHHQVVHKLGQDIIATAWTKDLAIEGIEVLKHPFGMGVQWHPEIMLTVSGSMLPLFKEFIGVCQR
ncbi:MAG: gamma-glutamyl-gamma-aminobutyrate hydrolase family protein [Niameybacter sp.]|uniref:gamma-glutamyl-gamma-aminobutyrate hydrolase family protein n=1 Tax=Niameybacter sp. TaxID=2033640 RepID=UPI002FCC3C05